MQGSRPTAATSAAICSGVTPSLCAARRNLLTVGASPFRLGRGKGGLVKPLTRAGYGEGWLRRSSFSKASTRCSNR